MSMNGPPGCDANEAVPSLINRPDVVVGRAVPGLFPLRAVATRCWCAVPLRWPVPTRVSPVKGLDEVPGLAKPVVGRPDCVKGRKAAEVLACVRGLDRDVPGLGADWIALSSNKISPAPAN